MAKIISSRKILNISPGTLQNLRVNGTLPYIKIGGVMYYSSFDIDSMMTGEGANDRAVETSKWLP